MTDLKGEVRHAWRRIKSKPGWAMLAILTLALGIGANAAVFSLVRGVLLEPLPYGEPDKLVMVWNPELTDETWLSAREWAEYERATRAFAELAAYTTSTANLTEGDEPERVRAGFITGNLLQTLGVQPLLGRPITNAEDANGRDDVVVLGYQLWQRRFAGAPDIINRPLRVNGRLRTVIGVMPADFRLPLDYREQHPTELWVPAAINRSEAGSWGDRSYFIVGRLRPGFTPESATQDVRRVTGEWAAQGIIHDRDRLNRQAYPLDSLLSGKLRPALLLLFGAVAFILLIACANVTNLLLARSESRRREVATQAALGASRGRIARELLLESSLLGMGGAVMGVLLAYLGLRATLALTPVTLLRMRDIAIDPIVLVFSIVLALVATLLAGSAPALELARVDLQAAMGAGGRAGGAHVRKRLRHALVIGQTALSVVLVIGAALLLRSFVELRKVDLGFSPERLLSFRLAVPQNDYPNPENVVTFYEQVVARVRGLPGVQNAAGVRLLPLTGTIGDWSIMIEGQPADPAANPNGDWQVVTPGYFETMGVQLVRGRFFNNADNATGAPVVIIDENMAKRYWPGEDALGKRFHLGTLDRPWMTIVGITRPVRHNAIVEEPRTEMFVPHAQFPAQTSSAPRAMTIVIKTAGEPMALLDAARREVRALDRRLPISEIQTMEEVAANALAQPRFLAALLGVFAALALTLASIGMYGVIAFLTSRREREIGLRMALGATGSTVARMVVTEGVLLAVSGVAIGALTAAWLTRFLATQLYAVQRLDPLTFALVPLTLIAVAALGAWLPARRAARFSPMVVMRGE